MPSSVPSRFSSCALLPAAVRAAAGARCARASLAGVAAVAIELVLAVAGSACVGVAALWLLASVVSGASTIIAAPLLPAVAGASGCPVTEVTDESGTASGFNEYSASSCVVLFDSHHSVAVVNASSSAQHAPTHSQARRRCGEWSLVARDDAATCRPSMSARMRPVFGAGPLFCAPPESRLGRLLPPLFKCFQPLV